MKKCRFYPFRVFEKAMGTMKEIGVSMERQNKTRMVNDLEDGFMEVLKSYEDSVNLSTSIDSVANIYRPKEWLFAYDIVKKNLAPNPGDEAKIRVPVSLIVGVLMGLALQYAHIRLSY